MDDEEGFLAGLAVTPTDLTAHLVYADWLDEHDDPGGACLRLWVELQGVKYEDGGYRLLFDLMDQFRAALRVADPMWVKLVGAAREWVGSEMAELSARLHLRVRDGRKLDRQWVGPVVRCAYHPVWRVSYWANPPARRQLAKPWRDQRSLSVDRVTGAIANPAEPAV